MTTNWRGFAAVGLGLLLWAAASGRLQAQTPLPMTPLEGAWEASAAGWRTAGERPPAGWYLRSERQYDLGGFTLEVKKAAPDDLVFVYLRDWQICLRPDSITARYAGLMTANFRGMTLGRPWGLYWYTATRPLAFRSTQWQTFSLAVADGGIVVSSGAKELLRFASPEAEWGERVRSSGRFAAFAPYVYPKQIEGVSGEKQVLIVHACGQGLELRGLRVAGQDAGAAEGFRSRDGRAKAEVIPAEDDLPLTRPRGLLAVDWRLDESEAERIGKLPPVADWTVPASAFVDTAPDLYKDLPGPRPGRTVFPAAMEYRPGSPDPGQVPNTLCMRWRFAGLPQEARVAFCLAEGGTYTLQLGWGVYGMGHGPNLLEIAIDGRPVVLEEYRALMKFYTCSPGLESIPLQLAAGPHRIDVRLVTDRFGTHQLMKLLRFPIGSLRLVRGTDVPWRSVDVRQPREATQKPPATTADFRRGEWNGPELNYRLTGLNAGQPYQVRLFFADCETVEPGSRTMTLAINGETVEQALDVFAETGWSKLLEKSYAVTAQPDADSPGKIEIQLRGGRRKALVNGVILNDADGREVFRENFGWHLSLEQYEQRRKDAVATPRLADAPVAAEPPPWTPKAVFDGHNVVANGHFALVDAERSGKPRFWSSLRELADCKTGKENFVAFYNLFPGKGEYQLDGQTGRTHPGALRLGAAEPGFGLTANLVIVDPGKRQRFAYFARGEAGAAPLRAAIVWLAKNRDAEENGPDFPLPAPILQVLSVAAGDPVTPGPEWQEVAVAAKPPPEAMFALLVVDAGDRDGTATWVDDAECNGYGAEPLEITRSFAGFHPRGDKTLIIKSFHQDPVVWQIRAAASDAVVAAGTVRASRYEWFSQRHYFQLDAGALREAGEYCLTATQGEARAESRFKVSPDVYRDVALTMLQGLRNRRFNDAVEQLRDPELLDYAAAVRVFPDDRFVGAYEPLMGKDRIDLTGGYYDAGDDIVHVEFWPCVVLATLNAVANAGTDRELRAKAAAEADWLLAAFHKYANPDGSLIITCKPQGYLLDNVPLYAYDPVAGESHNVTQTAGAAAMGAYALRPTNERLSRRYQEIAESNYETSRLWEVVAAAKEAGPRELSAAAKTLWAEMYLNRLSQKADYAARMDQSARLLAQGLRNRAYAQLAEMAIFADNAEKGGTMQDCVWVPILFVREYPEHPASPALREGLRAFAAHVAQLSAETVWGQAAALNAPAGEAPRRFPDGPGHRRGGYWAMLAYTLSEIGMLLHDEQTILLAEKQLQWCLGRNFADLSIVHGVGSRLLIGGNLAYSRDLYFSHWLQTPGQAMILAGGVPTAAFRDLGSGDGVSDAEARRHIPMPYIFPAGYCLMPPRPYYGTQPGRFPQPSEEYLPQVAQLNLAAASVNAALRSLAQAR